MEGAGDGNGLLDAEVLERATGYTHPPSCLLFLHRLQIGRVWSQASLRLRQGLWI